MQLETVIGLEVHLQLATQSKIFSGSSITFGAEPNTQASAVDLAMPGMLPVLNEQAVRMAVMFGLGIGVAIAFGLFLAALNAAFPDMPPPPAPPPVFNLADPEVFRSHMEAAGFRDVRVEHVAHDLEIRDVEQAWGMLTAGAPPIQALFDKVGADGKERIHEELRKVVARRFGSGPIRVRNVATLGSGTAG